MLGHIFKIGYKILIFLLFSMNTKAQEPIYTKREISFSSIHNVILSGTLYLPDSGLKKYPTIIAGHGSGKLTRNDSFIQELVANFTNKGYAVLAYDKRGTGLSGGAYLGSYSSSMLVYAMDAIAAYDYLMTHPNVDADKVGLVGISQAGFVIPMAASILKERLAFTIIFSGPTVSIFEENRYSDLTGDSSGKPTDLSLAQIKSEMQRTPSLGYDPYPFIEEMTMPALWLFGSLDKSIPVDQALKDLKEIKDKWNRKFTWHKFDGVNHAMKEATTGGSWENPRPTKTLKEVFPFAINWLEEYVK